MPETLPYLPRPCSLPRSVANQPSWPPASLPSLQVRGCLCLECLLPLSTPDPFVLPILPREGHFPGYLDSTCPSSEPKSHLPLGHVLREPLRSLKSACLGTCPNPSQLPQIYSSFRPPLNKCLTQVLNLLREGVSLPYSEYVVTRSC